MNLLSELKCLPSTNVFEPRPEVPYRLSEAEFKALAVSQDDLNARGAIERLQDFLWHQTTHEKILPDTIKPVHRLTKGIYHRELTMPEGSIVVGKRHSQEHIVMLTKGRCEVFTERGHEVLVAPATWMSPAGEKRVVVNLEETTWVTIHRTDETDIDAIEKDLCIAEPMPLLVNRSNEKLE